VVAACTGHARKAMALAEPTFVAAGALRMEVALAGSGPAVALLHGFPELWWSWRHQIPALADAGFSVVAPDMRGYGGTGVPEPIEAYDVLTLAGDVVALMRALGHERFAVVGHDWGAAVAWELARSHRERVTAVAGLSVPFAPRAPSPPMAILRRRLGEDFYMVWFQEPGVAEAALEADVRRTLRTQELWDARWARHEGDAPPRPAFWDAEDEARYVAAFSRTGFRGGLNWYRNIDRNWELTAAVAERRIEQPALFVTGSRDPVRHFMAAEAMDGWVTDLRDVVIVDGAGHWIQQQAPDAVNAALLPFLREHGRADIS
jgi:pimeloyl-ACP methyl ester carboxylesterase